MKSFLNEVKKVVSGGSTHYSALRRCLGLAGLLFLLVALGAWQDISGRTINPRFVERIEDGKTTKSQILMFFGDPQEVERTDAGPVFKYRSYKDAPLEKGPKGLFDRPIDDNASTPFYVDDEKKIKKVPTKTQGTILDCTLTIQFKADGETVMSHEYQKK